MAIIFQKIESLAILLASVITYYLYDFSWMLFALVLIVPDLFMIGYVRNSKVGALIYNIGHNYIPPLIFLMLYCVLKDPNALLVSIVWFAHIAMDRALGFGLKETTGFKDTHLGKIK